MNYKAYILKNIPEASTGSRRRLDFPTAMTWGEASDGADLKVWLIEGSVG